jgi:hypothetical protein
MSSAFRLVMLQSNIKITSFLCFFFVISSLWFSHGKRMKFWDSSGMEIAYKDREKKEKFLWSFWNFQKKKKWFFVNPSKLISKKQNLTVLTIKVNFLLITWCQQRGQHAIITPKLRLKIPRLFYISRKQFRKSKSENQNRLQYLNQTLR